MGSYGFNDEVVAAAPEAAAPVASVVEHARLDKPSGYDGHRWQVLVGGAWQGGVCEPGCAKETAEEHVS